MVLSDRTIKELIEAGRIGIDPFEPANVQPSSVDLRLGDRIRVFSNNHRHPYVDLRKPSEGMTELVTLAHGEPFILHPNEFVLGVTRESVALPDDLVGRLEGKSSLGRLGLLIHSTAGFVDPGWHGRLTLELANILTIPITLYVGMPVAQISFMRLTTPVDRPYVGKYQGDVDPMPSKYHLNFGEQNGADARL